MVPHYAQRAIYMLLAAIITVSSPVLGQTTYFKQKEANAGAAGPAIQTCKKTTAWHYRQGNCSLLLPVGGFKLVRYPLAGMTFSCESTCFTMPAPPGSGSAFQQVCPYDPNNPRREPFSCAFGDLYNPSDTQGYRPFRNAKTIAQTGRKRVPVVNVR